ncbi:MAG: hypothetical protein FJ290_08600 [Planctomycetes bacterium]|nr:hypothetical protein [Planctomycetota bacterium]
MLAWAACSALAFACSRQAAWLGTGPPPPPGAAQARVGPFRGWRRCAHLANGLIRVSVVPQVGGRTLEYALGDYNYLFLGQDEVGKTLSKGAPAGYRHFGGQFAQLHPEDRWATVRSGYPPDLFMGHYELHEAAAEAGRAAVELLSPVDLATGTRVSRRVELFPYSTRLRITDTLTNVRLVPQEWGIQAVLQLKGVSNPDGLVRREDPPRGDIALYAPLNRKSRFKGGVRFPLGGPGTFEPKPGLLTLRYRGRFAKAELDPALPWVVFVDHSSGHVFVQKCAAAQKALLSAGGAFAPYPFIEVQCFGKVAKLGPGESASLVQEWYATRCPEPIVDVTEAGVVSSPLSLLKGEGRTWVAGTFGVFAIGRAAVVFQAADGNELARVDCGPATPLEPFVLSRAVGLPPGTAHVRLDVTDPAGKAVGDLGSMALGASR